MSYLWSCSLMCHVMLGGVMFVRVGSLVLFLSLSVACLAPAQSLADLARKEKERRSKEAKPSRVIRNQDVKALGNAKVTHSTATPPAASPPAESSGTGTAGESTASQPPLDEARWRNALTEARLQLKLAENRALVLELRVNELRNRFLTESDGSTRSLIDQEMNRTLHELETDREDIAKADEALRKLEDSARKAGVPADWTHAEEKPPNS